VTSFVRLRAWDDAARAREAIGIYWNSVTRMVRTASRVSDNPHNRTCMKYVFVKKSKKERKRKNMAGMGRILERKQ
jgi:hypothetical protein